ncbi:SDR family NAD(P)-dependent oxidoreductase [Zavarzinella formosa]|uniref:SDR family NAD(P)-dependent oxidoreductase n=1 Tax=Zavarzinella formosa TaxID=360055 RepID=UPI0036F37EB5
MITGASSGIGLATAGAAAKAGARVVIASRSEEALNEITRRFSGAGNHVIAVACDVSERSHT